MTLANLVFWLIMALGGVEAVALGILFLWFRHEAKLKHLG